MTEKYTAEELSRHNRANDLWIVLHGKVYDITKFLQEHPGGEEVLLNLAGKDGTRCFDDIGHTQEAVLLKDAYQIGVLEESPLASEAAGAATTSRRAEEEPSVVEDDDDWTYEEPKKEKSSQLTIFLGLGALVYAVLFYYLLY